MQGNLTFDISIPEEQNCFNQAVNASLAFMKLWEIDNTLRNWLKYDNKMTKDECLMEIRDMIREERLLDYVQ